MYKAIIGSVIRYALQGAFVWLVSKGIITHEQSEWLIVGIGGSVAVLLWSLYQKYVAHNQRIQALFTPVPSATEDGNPKPNL